MTPRCLPLASRQVHLDFHTSELIPGIGSEFDPELFAQTLVQARVNSVTCFSRCHHGLIYHETRFPARHPYLQCDLLRLQIEACRRAGIRVPIYISVGFDEFMAARHPEWIELSPEGSRRGAPLSAGWKKLCLNSGYVDYVSEQTQEVLDLFGPVDGLFFDIIHQGQCCCPSCLQDMTRGGLDPASEIDRTAFAVEVLHRLRRRITAEVRERDAGCLIFWNSGHVSPALRPVLDCYSHLELESLPSGGWGYDHYPLTVRYARNLGLDHLGMTGKFVKTWAGFGELKNQEALEYECFTALAEGGKLSIGDQLHPRGALTAATYDLIGAVYRQVEAREPWCLGSQPVAEIAIFNPEAVGAHDGRVDTSSGGAYRMLVEHHYQVDLVDGEMDWGRYRLLILPDKIRLDPALAERVRHFLQQGGKVLASHHAGLSSDGDHFVVPELGVTYRAEGRFSPDYLRWRDSDDAPIPSAEQVLFDRGAEVDCTHGDVLAEIWHPYFNRAWNHFCSHRHAPVDRPSGFPAVVVTEQTAYVSHPLFASYLRHGVRTYKQVVLHLVQRLMPEPLVRTNAPTTARITVHRQAAEARTVVHLLHYIPEQRSREIQTVEEVIPLRDVRLQLRSDPPKQAVYLAPGKTPLAWSREADRIHLTVPEFRGHAMVVME